jgi:hypothetical protein
MKLFENLKSRLPFFPKVKGKNLSLFGVIMDQKFCVECAKKNRCYSLCGELATHLKADIEVSQKEITVGLPGGNIGAMPDIVRKFTLTERQAEVAACLLQGMDVKDVAKKLQISVRACNYLIENIRKHLRGIPEED